MNWFPFTYILTNLVTNSIYAWLTKDYRSAGMIKVTFLFRATFTDNNPAQEFEIRTKLRPVCAMAERKTNTKCDQLPTTFGNFAM